MNFRVGLGQDSHRFVGEGDKKPLILGGILFPNEKGLKANSDGDVVLHALCNALVSSVGEGSLSRYADEMCLKQGIKDSKKYVEVALNMITRRGYRVNNVSVVIECEKPKIEPMFEQMRESIASILKITPERVGISATTGEDLTPFGKGEGIQVFVIVSLVRS